MSLSFSLSEGFEISKEKLSNGISNAWHLLTSIGEYEGRVSASVLESDGPIALARWYYFLQQLSKQGALVVSVRDQDKPIISVLPTTQGLRFIPECEGNRESRFILSRFAYVHLVGNQLLLESPRSFCRMILHDARASAFVHALAEGGRRAELVQRLLTQGLADESISEMLNLFIGAGFAQELSTDGSSEEDTASLATWEFHDLLFHSRSRKGRHSNRCGATYAHLNRVPVPPSVKPATAGETIPLFRPTPEGAGRGGHTFAVVQEKRRSIREYGKVPMTLTELGEFLYRAARVKACSDLDLETPRGPLRMEFTQRPYPGGGGLYELELYVVVNACEGLPAGLYHYDPRDHFLRKLSGPTENTEALLQSAGGSASMDPKCLQVLLVITSRFQRIAWKYSSLAYALTLKNVGALYQTMYLVATAMGLAPSALGGGDSDLFARAAGLDYYEETSVGEFILGSR